MKSLEKKVQVAFNSKSKKKVEEALAERKEYFEKHKESIKNSAKVFWGKLYDKRRKICKRPCMTYFYSCQTETMAGAMMKDHGDDPAFAGINSNYTFYLARLIYNACQGEDEEANRTYGLVH